MRAGLIAVSLLACVAGPAVASPLLRAVREKPVGTPRLGWSAPGHEIIARVATTLLTPTTMTHVTNILPSNETLESDSTWADTVRYEAGWEWSAPLHFINTPDWACNFQPARDCADSMCVYGAIVNYTLRTSKMSGEQQYEALKFVTHFVGDIHQPLHCAFASDYGGNSITGTFLGQSVNLHHTWDYNILNNRISLDFNNDQDAFATWLGQQIAGPWASNVTEWTSCVTPGSKTCVQGWAEESTALACTYAYTDENGNHIENGFDLGTPYYDFTIPIVEMQLAKGAVRLAGLLNAIWAAEELPTSSIVAQQ